MEAVIRVSAFEFDEKLFAKIKSLLQSSDATEVTIRIATSDSTNIPEDPKAEYWNKIERSTHEIEQGKGVVFTMQEFEEYVSKNFPR